MLHYLYLSVNIFVMAMLGLSLSRKNMMMILMVLELLLLSANINLMVASMYLDDFLGQIYSLMIFCTGAAESSMGLALMMIYYSLRGGISVDLMCLLKG